MRVLCTLFEGGFYGAFIKGQMPQKYTVVSLIADLKAFIFQIFRVCKKRLFLFCG